MAQPGEQTSMNISCNDEPRNVTHRTPTISDLVDASAKKYEARWKLDEACQFATNGVLPAVVPGAAAAAAGDPVALSKGRPMWAKNSASDSE
jgi:hypothetical protein